MNYNQQDFAKALEGAGFKRDKSFYQSGALFFNISFKAGKFTNHVQVSLYQTSLTMCLLIPGKDGLRVVEHFSTSSQEQFLLKAQEWGLK